MTSNRTVPTRVVNKNGVSTTVHKRVDNSGSGSRKAIPAVAAPASPGTGMTVADLESHGGGLAFIVLNELGRNRHRLSDRVKEKTLATLHPETLDRLEKVKVTVLNIYTRTIDSCLANRNFTLLNNLSLFLTEESIDGKMLDKYVAGLVVNKGTPKSPYSYSDATESEMESARALMHAAMELPSRDYLYEFTTAKGQSIFLRSELLRELIEERPQDVERIVDLLKSRKLPVETDSDIASLRELLDDASHPAIGSGAL